MVSINRRDFLGYQELKVMKPNDLHIQSKRIDDDSPGSKSTHCASQDWRSDLSTTADSPGAKDTNAEACIYRTAFSLLNKLTKDNFPSVSKKFTALNVKSPEFISGLSDMIFNKAVMEHSYSETYADLCLLLQQSYPSFPALEAGRPPVTFASTLLNKCQQEFKNIPQNLDEPHVRASQMSGNSQEELGSAVMLTKKRLSGLMKFIAHLYLRDLLSNKVIREVGLHLVFKSQCPEPHYILCFCVLLKNVGSTFDSTSVGQDYMNTFHLRLAELHDSGAYDTRIKFFITDLRELRENKWIDTRAMAQVQTKEAIRAQKEAEAAMGQTGKAFVEKVAGERPVYIQQQMAKVAATRVFDAEKVNNVLDYYWEDQSADDAISDWRGLELDAASYDKAIATLIIRGYNQPKKAEHVLKLFAILHEFISGKKLAHALTVVQPELQEALIDNPSAARFHESLVEYKNKLC